jgi:DNA-binding NarL/FixJ family response regulator
MARAAIGDNLYVLSTLPAGPSERRLATAMAHFDARRPLFVVVDKNLPDANGLDLTRTIKKLSPATMVAVTSIETNAHIGAQALAAGAVAFIGKDKLFDEIVPLVGAAVTLTEWMEVMPSFSISAQNHA